MRIYKGMVYFFSIFGLIALLTYFIFALVFFKKLETGRILRIGRQVYGVVTGEL